jgi:type 1 glutamine amidotransferase
MMRRASLGVAALVFASFGCDGAEPRDGGGAGGVAGASGGASGAAAASGGAGSGGAPGGAGGAGGGAGGSSGGALRVLAFSRTMVFRHDSIAAGHAALTAIAAGRGFELEASEEVSSISDAVLAEKDVLVFLSTSGDVLDAAAEGALMRFIQAGGGFVGVHAASDTEYDFAFYGGLVGAYINAHPDIQPATIVVEDATHPATAHLAATWVRTDEWYGFRENPRANVRVLLRLDETSYDPGLGTMGDDHPIAWAHEYEGGRAFYTALGHTAESYAEPAFLEHLAGAIAWAGGLAN